MLKKGGDRYNRLITMHTNFVKIYTRPWPGSVTFTELDYNTLQRATCYMRSRDTYMDLKSLQKLHSALFFKSKTILRDGLREKLNATHAIC